MTELTAQQFVERIRDAAEKGEFTKAQHLRETLLATHTLALKESIAAAEIIEEQMTAQIDAIHIQRWDTLYSPLTREEQNALFYSSKAARCAQGTALFVQGKRNPRLFFIDDGEVNLIHKKEQTLHHIVTLTQGSLIGEESLLDITLATFSAVCKTAVQIRYLDKTLLAECAKQFPGIPKWLTDYCLRSHSKKLQNIKNIEKRSSQRLPMYGTATAHILSPDGVRTQNSFKGIIQDISKGGISFNIRCSKRETVEILLGKLLELDIGNKILQNSLYGKVVRIGSFLHNDYSVHVRFRKPLSESTVLQLAGPKKQFQETI